MSEKIIENQNGEFKEDVLEETLEHLTNNKGDDEDE